jgi:hypothetical protein
MDSRVSLAQFLAYPSDFDEGLLPARHDSLYKLIRAQKTIPRSAYQLVPPAPASALSTALPNTSHAAVKSLGVPSAPWIESVKQELRRRVSCGEAVRSVMHPIHAEIRVAPWVLSYWKKIAEIHVETAGWNKADDWVTRCARGDQRALDVARRIRELFEIVPWGHDVLVAGIQMPVGTLRRLLATGHDGWLNTDLMDVAIGLIQREVNRDSRLRHVLLGDCGFQDFLVNQKFSSMEPWQKQIRAGETLLVFPGNKQLHWYGFRVCFRSKTISYGKYNAPIFDPS